MFITKSANTESGRSDFASTPSDLVKELTDATAEQLSGGAISTPDTKGGNSGKTPATLGNSGLNLILPPTPPVAATLPTPKLARLGPLSLANKTNEKEDTPPPQP
ncbi:hypothetical protein Cylst_1819 [Cylindrospermum stagnale PCC 7417]|uniref:Uncharacterized protein n=1 Tax=Cylindrospermum stagnale PCC 7417 TaxID=56107 RepID=K9WV59_9NOST|nr:hypothetical protein [Cylindrospermum stagnale]AFZ24078.1 hypothetical protein Cylst_1819 [Cylindrospermum stagnale PCC 7417]